LSLSTVERDIPGAYQLNALLSGWAFQRAWHRARLDLVARLLPPRPGLLNLDAAAGSGILTWHFRSPYVVSSDMRVSAGQAVRAHTPGARSVVADMRALPFQSGTIDQAYFLEAIEHLSAADGQRAAGELRRTARTGGRALVTTPNYSSYWVALERLLDMLRLTPPLADAQHLTRYTADSLQRILEGCGWRVLRSGSFNLFAPFAGVMSPRAGVRAIDAELARLRRSGALLYALCEAA